MILDMIDRMAGRWMDWRTGQKLEKDSELREFNLKRFDQTPEGYTIMATAPGIAILADQAAQLLVANNAKNYVQFDMLPRLDRDLRPIRVTVQWAGGESPATKAARLERELERLTEGRMTNEST